MRLYHVYLHIRPDTGVVFYVGKGKGRRAYQLYGRSEYHTSIQKKLAAMGFSVEIRVIATDLTNDEACALEVQQISHWKERGGANANFTIGGDGAPGRKQTDEWKARHSKFMREEFVLTEEQRAKISAAKKGKPRTTEERAAISAACKGIKRGPPSEEHKANLSKANKGRKASPEERQRMSERRRGVPANPETVRKRALANTGKKRTDETRAKMSASAKRRPIICLNDMRVFDSAKEAAEFYDVGISNLCMVCKGKLKQTKGLKFSYHQVNSEVGEYHGK